MCVLYVCVRREAGDAYLERVVSELANDRPLSDLTYELPPRLANQGEDGDSLQSATAHAESIENSLKGQCTCGCRLQWLCCCGCSMYASEVFVFFVVAVVCCSLCYFCCCFHAADGAAIGHGNHMHALGCLS